MPATETTRALVTMRDVGMRYANGTHALIGFSLDVLPGEFLSLLGPSGCGKSTVLRLLSGLAAPTSGSLVREWEPDGPPRRGEAVGCVFQDPTLLPWSTVWNNVYLPLRLRGESRSAARAVIDRTLDMVGLGEFAGAYPRELSGGMRMRAALARALVTRPRLLLLDEPFAALDEITRFRLNDDLQRLWRDQGMSVVFVTHSVYESAYLSTRVVVLSDRPGRVVEEIPVHLERPRSEATRASAGYLAVCERASAALHRAASQGEPVATRSAGV